MPSASATSSTPARPPRRMPAILQRQASSERTVPVTSWVSGSWNSVPASAPSRAGPCRADQAAPSARARRSPTVEMRDESAGGAEQRRLAVAGEPGEHDSSPARDLEADVSQRRGAHTRVAIGDVLEGQVRRHRSMPRRSQNGSRRPRKRAHKERAGAHRRLDHRIVGGRPGRRGVPPPPARHRNARAHECDVPWRDQERTARERLLKCAVDGTPNQPARVEPSPRPRRAPPRRSPAPRVSPRRRSRGPARRCDRTEQRDPRARTTGLAARTAALRLGDAPGVAARSGIMRIATSRSARSEQEATHRAQHLVGIDREAGEGRDQDHQRHLQRDTAPKTNASTVISRWPNGPRLPIRATTVSPSRATSTLITTIGIATHRRGAQRAKSGAPHACRRARAEHRDQQRDQNQRRTQPPSTEAISAIAQNAAAARTRGVQRTGEPPHNTTGSKPAFFALHSYCLNGSFSAAGRESQSEAIAQVHSRRRHARPFPRRRRRCR